MSRRTLGVSGEERAAQWYAEHGYHVLARNWRCKEGELDLIARRDRTYVFCEVKTRTSEVFGLPAEAVTPLKQTRIRRLAARWLAQQGEHPPGQIRFDVVAILGAQLEVIEGAF